MRRREPRLLRARRGHTAIEYALIAGLITLALIPAITSWGESAKAKWDSAAAAMPG
jgi:Flp pilus assembly pilin Flp